MTDDTPKEVNLAHAAAEDFKELEKSIGSAPIAPAHGIAGMALSMSMKYHNMAMVKDGTMYQQYKMEGRNIREIDLSDILKTAEEIEIWLLGASERIAKVVVEAIEWKLEDDESQPKEPSAPEDDSAQTKG